MRKQFRFWILAFMLATGQAFGAFHLWTMAELYSNADGSVQFLELRAVTGGQQFLAEHSLSTSSGGVTRSFTFPSGLPGDTNNRSMLVGTEGFAALGVVTPDFIVPNGFFFKGGGRISFAENADVWDHGPIPDGVLSLNRNGSSGTNSPLNFAGRTGSVPASAPAAFNLQGLWWNDPDFSESGWGLNIAHQGDILFTSWFTYDADGSGMWLFQSRAERIGANSYRGDIFRATGAPFDNYDVTRVAVNPVPVGSGTLTFADAGHGTFAYIVNSTTQSKSIKRFDFAAPVPTCTQSGTHGASPIYTDLWRGEPRETQNGWGLNIVHQGETLFISWFTYDATGRGMWLYGVPQRSSGQTFTGALTRNTGPNFSSSPWNQPSMPVTPTTVGNVTLAFSDASSGTFTYTVGSVTQTKTIVRNIFATPASICR